MSRFAILLALLLPGPAFAQTSGASPAPLCSALPSTVEADNLGSINGNGFYRVDGSAPSPRAGTAQGLDFELHGPRHVRRGQPLGLSLRVTNRTRTEAVVMRSMDGSMEHMRDPSYDLYLRRVGSAEVYRWDFHGGRCGMTNPVTAEDYVPIAAGATNDTLPGPWGAHLQSATISTAGEYEAWLVYRQCGGMNNTFPPSQGAAGPAPATGEFVSAAIRFRVR